MINYIIDLIGSIIPLWDYVFQMIFALSFVATVPCIIREIVRFR